MKLLRGFRCFSELSAGSAVTIGNFDGVHRGHQALLKTLCQQADMRQLSVVVMLFEPQPGEYFSANQAPARLSSFREKMDALAQCGVDYVYCLKFEHYLACMEARHFAEQIIFSSLKAKYVLIGEDFRFGRGREGDAELLQQIGALHSSVVACFHDFYIDAERVSSTKIRLALQHDLAMAAAFLGRPYSMCGRVVHGDGRGRQWGVPTANISLHRSTLPMSGVYCVLVESKGKPPLYGVANLGCRPTVDGRRNVLEIHLFDWNKSLYGDMLHVTFLHKLRKEEKFPTIDDLIAQIHADLNSAKQWFHHREMSYD
ncbi:MAG: bifunctional riboflavin kinase/FAD synthetase [Legionellales bacterium]|nr:bifunctional riboflavin kinase/FAD synthetase [Legionellales bacterium]